jgi:hypothetical protein
MHSGLPQARSLLPARRARRCISYLTQMRGTILILCVSDGNRSRCDACREACPNERARMNIRAGISAPKRICRILRHWSMIADEFSGDSRVQSVGRGATNSHETSSWRLAPAISRHSRHLKKPCRTPAHRVGLTPRPWGASRLLPFPNTKSAGKMDPIVRDKQPCSGSRISPDKAIWVR